VPEAVADLLREVLPFTIGIDVRTAPAGPLTLQWEFPDAEPWHLRLDNGSTAVSPGLVEQADITLRVR